MMGFNDLVAGAVTRGIGFMDDATRHKIADKMSARQAASDHEFAETVVHNLTTVFPAMSKANIQNLALLNCKRMARARLDHLWSWHASARELAALASLSGAKELPGNSACIIVGCHQLGMEVAAMRLSVEVEGAIVVDPGSETLLGAAKRAWSRFRPQTIIEAEGAFRPALRVLKAGKPLLLFPDEPEIAGHHRVPAQVIGAMVQYSPIVSILAKAAAAPVFWLQVDQQADGHYRVSLEQLAAATEAVDMHKTIQMQAKKLEEFLRTDPSAYWWSRRRLAAARSRAGYGLAGAKRRQVQQEQVSRSLIAAS
ncbi:MAG: hypothetical protein AB8C46_07925 [Burkholderiaceae bacterium]